MWSLIVILVYAYILRLREVHLNMRQRLISMHYTTAIFTTLFTAILNYIQTCPDTINYCNGICKYTMK